ncbi:MAG: GntR family transcriptional regulator [Pseudomonadota bacterium]
MASIDRTKPLRDQVYALIRLMILTGSLRPGGTLDEKAIAAQLGVSRTPVREAVQKLSAEDLVEIKPQSGTLVAAISPSAIFQAYMIRRALESETVATASANMTPGDAVRLEGNFQQHQMALAQEQFVEAIRLDDEFHRIIAEIADLPLLWRAITLFKAQIDRCRYQTIVSKGSSEATLQQHRDIMEALEKRDPTLAKEQMQAHLDRTYKVIEDFLERGGAD